MNRKELYAKVKELHLEEEIKSLLGKNYTMVSNDDLNKIVEQKMKALEKKAKKQSVTGVSPKVENAGNNCPVKDVVIKLIAHLKTYRVLSPEVAEELCSSL